MSRFNMGKLLMTRTINDTIADNLEFSKEIMSALHRYICCDWGDMCREDKELNNNAVKSGSDRIVAAYETSVSKVYIITEYDRTYTTILFANEY